MFYSARIWAYFACRPMAFCKLVSSENVAKTAADVNIDSLKSLSDVAEHVITQNDTFRVSYHSAASPIGSGNLIFEVLPPYRWRYEGKEIALIFHGSIEIVLGKVMDGRFTAVVSEKILEKSGIEILVVPKKCKTAIESSGQSWKAFTFHRQNKTGVRLLSSGKNWSKLPALYEKKVPPDQSGQTRTKRIILDFWRR